MDHDLHNMNEFFCEGDESHYPVPTNDKTTRRSSIEIKQEYLISPVINHNTPKLFYMHSPSPLKQNISFYEQDQSYSYDCHDLSPYDTRRRVIKNVLNFEDSPNKKVYQISTASTQRVANKSADISAFSSGIKDGKRNSKGLRNLSESVYKIVLQLQVTTYKQVADHLVKLLNAGQFGSLDENDSKSKDEQNIKRRVYDALNVLISADVLKKNAKYVMSDQQVMTERVKSSLKNAKKEDTEDLREQMLKKQKVVRQKKEKIQQLRNKKQILNAIMKRNRKKKHSKQKIAFPIVGITYRKSIPKIKRSKNNSEVLLPLENIEEVVGDMDLLLKVGIDLLSQNIDEVIEEVSQEDFEVESSLRKRKPQVTTTNKSKISKVLYSL